MVWMRAGRGERGTGGELVSSSRPRLTAEDYLPGMRLPLIVMARDRDAGRRPRPRDG